MSTYALATLPDDLTLRAQADRLRQAHASLRAALAQPPPKTQGTADPEYHALEAEMAAVESRLGIATLLARAAERASVRAARLIGFRPVWMHRYEANLVSEAMQDETAEQDADLQSRVKPSRAAK